MEISIQVPDELLGERSERDRLTEGLRLAAWLMLHPSAALDTVGVELASWLGRGTASVPHASVALRARAMELLQKNAESQLSEAESAELERVERLDAFMTLVKARIVEQTSCAAA